VPEKRTRVGCDKCTYGYGRDDVGPTRVSRFEAWCEARFERSDTACNHYYFRLHWQSRSKPRCCQVAGNLMRA